MVNIQSTKIISLLEEIKDEIIYLISDDAPILEKIDEMLAKLSSEED